MADKDIPIVKYIKHGPIEIPVFWASELDSIDLIEEKLLQDNPGSNFCEFYVIANQSIEESTGTNSTVKTLEPTMFHVLRTIFGRVISKPKVPQTGLMTTVRSSAMYSLPPIPWELVQKMDKFFRKVELALGTESIVILTYDPSFLDQENASEGWDIIVPKQQNTSMNCKYDPPSVLALLPENALIVGSVHSHPGMSAYFSGTDEHDQMDWDGVHITFGWQKSVNNGATQYHIAMVLDKHEYSLTEHQVFAPAPLPDFDDSVVDVMLENVEKKYPPQHQTGTGFSHGATTGQNAGGTVNSYMAPIPSTSYMPDQKTRKIILPAGSPDPGQVCIIGRLASDKAKSCPFCDSPLMSSSVGRRRCPNCTSFLALPGETMAQIHDLRLSQNYPYDIYIDPEKAPKPVVFMELNKQFSDDVREGAFPKA